MRHSRYLGCQIGPLVIDQHAAHGVSVQGLLGGNILWTSFGPRTRLDTIFRFFVANPRMSLHQSFLVLILIVQVTYCCWDRSWLECS
jgi:hypothetical protein